MFKVCKPPPDARILRMREYEDKLRRMQDFCAAEQKSGLVAHWEACTNEKIERNKVLREHSRLQEQQAEQLHARRERLARKLYEEEMALQAELLSLKTTPEEKRSKLAAEAKRLWEAREGERQAQASALLDRHFRENSDALRAEMSRKQTLATDAVRRQQVQENTERRKAEQEEKHMWEACEAFEGFKSTLKGVAEAQKSANDKYLTERMLDSQLRDKQLRQHEEAAQAAAELEKMQLLEAERAAADAARARAAQERANALAEEIRAYNLAKQEADRLKSAEELEADKRWMADVLARERQQMQAEAAVHERQQAELKSWALALQDSAKAQALDQQEMDRLIQKYQDQQWARYDAQQAELQAARAALMEDVRAARARQVAERQAARDAAIAAGMHERARVAAQERQVATMEEQERERAQQEALRHRLGLEAKIAFNDARRQVSAAEKQRERAAGADAEERYQAKVAEASQHEPPKYFGRQKVQWYY